jgi:hypothetical protein
MVLPEGFEPPRCLGVSQMPWAAWRREPGVWCARQDSNLHCTPSEGVASCHLGYWRMVPSAGYDPTTSPIPAECSAN